MRHCEPLHDHQAQYSAVELSKQAWNQPWVCLARIFSQDHIAPPVKAIFNPPVIVHLLQGVPEWRSVQGETAQSIDDLVAEHTSFHDVHPAFEAKHLLNPFPVFAEPAIKIRTTADLSMFQAPMSFVPGFGVLLSPPIRGRVGKQIGDICSETGLIVFGNEEVIAPEAMDLSTGGALGMHRIQAHSSSFHALGRKPQFERADLIVFF